MAAYFNAAKSVALRELPVVGVAVYEIKFVN
jgi:hypothetical protein